MAGPALVDFGAVFEVLPTPSLVLDTDLVIVAVNGAYLRAVSCTRADVLGRYVFDAFPDNPDDPGASATANLRASLQRVLQTASPETMPLQKYDVPAVGGGFLRRWWSPVNVPVLDEAGRVRLVLHRVEDVTSYVDVQLGIDAAFADATLAAAPDSVAGMAVGSVLVSARADLRQAASDLVVRGQELRAAMEAARRAAVQQAGLVAIARSLGEAQDEGAVLEVIAEHGTRLLGASGVALCLHEPDGPHVRLLITDTIDADVRTAVHVLPVDFPLPVVHTAATGEPHFHDDRATTVARFPGADQIDLASNTQASANAPLRAHAHLLGSLSMAFTQSRTWPPQDRDLVSGFAAMITQALERLAARDAERAASATAARFSETLQRSMLSAPPQLDHLQLVVRYSPAAAQSQVGGDWYDAFVTAGGCTSLVIGDVAGHDQAAAAVMGQLRNLLRGIGHATGAAPAAALSALDHAAHDLGVDGLASVVVAQVEQPGEHARAGTRVLRWSNAGHPPPLLLEPGAPPRFLDAGTDLIIGLDPDTIRSDHQVVLAPGASVLFYTDGLVERRGAALDQGLRWLREAAGGLSHRSLDELCDGLLELVGGKVEDDVALLALCAYPEDAPRPAEAGPIYDPRQAPTLTSSADPGSNDTGGSDDAVAADVGGVDGDRDGHLDGTRSAVLHLDPDPAEVARARTFVHDYCCRLAECEDVCDTLNLLVSEIVTNAVLHGRSQSQLRVSATTAAVRVEVTDDDSRLPVLAPADPEALGGRGLAMVDLLATAWGVREEAVGKTVWVELHTS